MSLNKDSFFFTLLLERRYGIIDWIKTSEKLPNCDGDFLVTKRFKGWGDDYLYFVDIITFDNDSKVFREWSDTQEDYIDCTSNIVAWAPAPEPLRI